MSPMAWLNHNGTHYFYYIDDDGSVHVATAPSQYGPYTKHSDNPPAAHEPSEGAKDADLTESQT